MDMVQVLLVERVESSHLREREVGLMQWFSKVALGPPMPETWSACSACTFLGPTLDSWWGVLIQVSCC